jgi:hypothetical protein
MGRDQEGWQSGAASDGEEPLRPRALAAVTDWCRTNRHRPIKDQHAHLSAMMGGHYAYYGVLATIDDCAGTPTRSRASGRNGYRDEIAANGSSGAASAIY